MTPLEIIALLGALLILVKIIVIAIKPKLWMKFPDHVFKHPKVTMVGFLLVAFLVLYFLMGEMNILQVFGGVLFGALLMGSAFASFPKEFTEFAKKMLKDKNVLAEAIIPVVVWVLLALWVLYALFA